MSFSEEEQVEESEGVRNRLFAAGALVGAMVVGVAWLFQWALTRGPEPAQEIGDAGRPVAGSPAAAVEPTTHLSRCQDVFHLQHPPLRAAAAPMAQWEVHIGAMNKLVVGAITLDQAWQFWNQTLVGAQRRLDGFAEARRPFDQRISRCPPPPRSAEGDRRLRTCFRAVDARNEALRRATIALRTWQEHVHHMEMLRNGQMSASQATRLWLQNWRAGDREVRAYRAAARASRGTTC